MTARLATRALLTILALYFPVTASAQAMAERALDIVREMDRANRGYRDLEARLEMRIHRSGDPILIRSMIVSGLEAQDGDRTMMVLEEPADLAGTTFLSVQGDDGRRAQWMYLPKTGRVRRISGSRSSDRFFGSHFTYDDLTPPTASCTKTRTRSHAARLR